MSIFGKAVRIRKVLQQSGASPQGTIFIGDELRDLEAAQKAGIAFGAVAWGYTDVGAFQERAPQEVFSFVRVLSLEILIEPGGRILWYISSTKPLLSSL